MTPAQRHKERIHQLLCVVHLKRYGQKVKMQEGHHLESVRGPHSAFAMVPLCKACHDGLHGDRRRPFYAAHKLDDVKLLAWTIELLAKVPMP